MNPRSLAAAALLTVVAAAAAPARAALPSAGPRPNVLFINKAGNPAYDYWMDFSAMNLVDEQTTDGHIALRITQLMEQHAKGKLGSAANLTAPGRSSNQGGNEAKEERGNEAASAQERQPFFLAAGFRRPHLLWVAPKKYFDRYPWQSMRAKNRDEPADDAADIPKAARTRGAPEMSEDQQKNAIAAYYACVAMVDTGVGKILDQMDQLDLWDNTIVIFTSDHGWHLNNHGGLWGKVTLFEESAKVPLIIYTPPTAGALPAAGALPSAGPAGPAGSLSPRIVEMLDIYPTLCELAGLPLPTTGKLDGISLVPQLNDPAAPRPGDKPAYSVLRRGTIWGKSLYTERYRYAEYGDGGKSGFELYDLANDPREYENLAAHPAHAATRTRMKALLDKEIRLTDAPGAEQGTKD